MVAAAYLTARDRKKNAFNDFLFYFLFEFVGCNIIDHCRAFDFDFHNDLIFGYQE